MLCNATPHLSIEEVAQIFQQDGSDLQEALNAYEKAGEWYDTESAPAYVFLPAILVDEYGQY